MGAVGFVDVGNSRIKLSELHGDELSPAVVINRQDQLKRFDVLVACMVGEQARMNETAFYLKNASDCFFNVSRSDVLPHINSSYKTPDTLGMDRILAVYALKEFSGDYIVIDAGTAVTIDIVSQGQHLGGYIIPGVSTQLSSLSDYANLPEVTSSLAGADLGRSTPECMAFGVWSGLVAQIERIAGKYKGSAVYLTGGDAPQLGSLIDCDHILADNLVLAGLHRYWLENLR